MDLNDQVRAEMVGKQLTSLLAQTGISIVGLAHAIDMSPNHLRTVKNGRASISSKTAGKIADFFEIEIGILFSSKTFKLKKIENIETIRCFYSENEHNSQFFLYGKVKNSVAYFLREVLLPFGFFSENREVNEIQAFAKSKFKKDFSSKELSRQLNRLAVAGLLSKTDKTGNRSIFLYRIS